MTSLRPLNDSASGRRDLRFLETFQDSLTGCRTELALASSTVHRVVAAFAAHSAVLASYDPVSDGLETVHAAGAKLRWDEDVLLQAAHERRTVMHGPVLAVPVLADGGQESEARVWGVLAVTREDGVWTAGERQTLRSAATRLGGELGWRRLVLLDDVLDGLLRKTKPIDVYTHALRELRRFVPYNHGASIMTTQRGVAQLTVRAEKVVERRGRKVSLVDSSRRGRVLRLTEGQMEYLGNLTVPFVLAKRGSTYALDGEECWDAPQLWRLFGLDDGSEQGSVLCAPLLFGGQVLGILRLAARRADAFDAGVARERAIERFGRLLSVTLYRSEIYYQSDRQLQAIKQIGRTITDPIPVKDICDEVLHLALRVLHVQVGAVGLLNEDGQLDLVAHHGSTLETPPVLGADEGMVGVVVRSGRSRAVPDVGREAAYVVFNQRVCSELIAPIAYAGEVIGFLAVESFELGRFREEDEEVVTFLEALANQAAIAIRTSQLHFEAVHRLGTALALDPDLSTAGLQDLLIQELRDKIDKLAAANARLAAANQAKSEFLARMSHDLRGPLNVIVGLANLLTDPAVGPSLTEEKRTESLEVIQSSGDVLASLIGNILDLSALEAGKVQLDRRPVDAQAAFAYLQAMTATLAQEAGRDLAIEVVVESEIGTLMVDEEKFIRILINLTSNAVKFTPSGGRIEVRGWVDRDSDQASALHVTVSDTGVGIAVEHHEAIFEPFRRMNGSVSGGHHGTGLGLAVVQQLVELAGGRVWVDSTPGAGSTFHVILPGALDAAPRDEPSSPAPSVRRPVGAVSLGTEQSREDAFSRGLVLVVEDTDAHMNLMRLAVTSRGYRMHGVTSGEEALDWLGRNQPDVVLLDMQLPGIDGFSVAAEIRGRVETQTIPLIAVTADALAANEERARASGCDAYITKPIDIGALMAAIDAVAPRRDQVRS